MFGAYIKYHIKSLGLFCGFTMIYILIFGLYHLPVEAVAYAAGLCLFLAFIVFLRDYPKFCRKHKLIQYLEKEILVTAEHFPQADNQIEMDYQRVIQLLYEEKQHMEGVMSHKYTDMMDYYTVWVHQIKTPIAAMRLQLQGEDSEQSRELQEELQRIEQYVEMVLAYLRLDAGTTDYLLRKYDLDDIIRQALRKYASQFIRKRIALDYKPTGYRVLTDEKWLLFVIEQVLSNALKYTKSGTISIEMTKRGILCIRDTGIGIAPEDLPRIFEKGYTGYNGRNDKKASGIGLYLCRRICHNLKHFISAESRVDEGTTVEIHLERKKLEVE